MTHWGCDGAAAVVLDVDVAVVAVAALLAARAYTEVAFDYPSLWLGKEVAECELGVQAGSLAGEGAGMLRGECPHTGQAGRQV